MFTSSQMLDCRVGCLLERVPSQQLPPYKVYQPEERINSKESVFVICQGLVACSWGHMSERRCLEILGSGDIWGKWTCAAGEGETWALGEVRGRWIGHPQWSALLGQPLVQERFLSYQQRHWQRQHEWQLVLAYGSVRARLAWQVLDLARRFGERDEATKEIFVLVHLTQQRWAQLVGASRTRLWEALVEFERKRWLVCGHEGFWVRDAGALRQQSHEGL